MRHALQRADPPFSGSYDPADVTFLLKPVRLRPTATAAKERLIQSGARHYSEMVPREIVPDDDYLALYREALARNGRRLARDIVDLAGALAARAAGRDQVVIASLARAGTPIGVLLGRAIRRLGLGATHYSISIVRDRGVDLEALRHIAAAHDTKDAVFVDGWTGKGAIAGELRRSLADRPCGFAPFLAVVADPAGQADLAATDEDYLIPSGMLNGIVSGLISRTILSEAAVAPGDFHACVHYRELAPRDLSRAFVDAVDAWARALAPRPIARTNADRAEAARRCAATLAELSARYGVSDRNRIKPGVAEATRAVLRRLPERLLVRDAGDPDVRHLIQLARDHQLAIDALPADSRYRAMTIIRPLGRNGEKAT